MDTEKIKHWLLHRDHYYNLRTMELLQNLVFLAIAIIVFFVFYSNADALNAEPILIFRLGGIILLLLLVGGLFFAKKAFTNLKYGFKGAPNVVKLIVLLFLLNAAIFAYQNQEEIGKFFEKKNTNKIIGKLSPIFFSSKSIEKDELLYTPQQEGEELAEEPLGLIDHIENINESIEEAEKDYAENQRKTEQQFIETVENLVFLKTNELRTNPLKWNKDLAIIAREHSEDMANRNFFSHDNPDGDGPTERAQKHGINIKTPQGGGVFQIGIAENISQVPTGNVIGCGYVYSAEEVAECAVSGWIISPGHYANMVDSSYSEIGVGVAKNNSGVYYLTQDFR